MPAERVSTVAYPRAAAAEGSEVALVQRCLVTGLFVIGVVFVAGCSRSDGRGALEMETRFTLCGKTGCVQMPAANADVVIFRNDVEVGRAQLDSSGFLSRRVEPGMYQVRVRMPELGLRAETTQMDLNADGGVSWSVRMGPRLRATPVD